MQSSAAGDLKLVRDPCMRGVALPAFVPTRIWRAAALCRPDNRVKDVMTANPYTVRPETGLDEAAT
jgi:hypothetical protein